MSERFLALACYVVPNPLKPLIGSSGGDRVRHHYLQAMGLSSVLMALVMLSLLFFLAVSAALVFWPWGFATLRLEAAMNWTQAALFGTWILLLVTAAGCALLGSTRSLPIVARLGRRTWLRRSTWCLWLVAAILDVALAGVTAHSTRIARHYDDRPAEVYALFDDMGVAPRWLFTLASYRLASAAVERWGEGSVVVDSITTERMAGALHGGRFVYLGTHGSWVPGGMGIEDGEVHPDADWLRPGVDLSYVYIAACEAGADAEAWRRALAPAEVVTFDRLSAVIEHAWWLWFTAPRVVTSLR